MNMCCAWEIRDDLEKPNQFEPGRTQLPNSRIHPEFDQKWVELEGSACQRTMRVSNSCGCLVRGPKCMSYCAQCQRLHCKGSLNLASVLGKAG